jgi:hypothetical protein
MSNLTRRAILRGSTFATVAAAISSLPAISLAESIGAPASTDPLVALAVRSAQLNVASRANYQRYLMLQVAHAPDDMRHLLDGLWQSDVSDEMRARWGEFTRWCLHESDRGEDPEARVDEICDIQRKICRTPARTLDGLLAKLRWAVDNISDEADPEIPTLQDAYDFDGADWSLRMLASIWADAERLLAGKGGAA